MNAPWPLDKCQYPSSYDGYYTGSLTPTSYLISELRKSGAYIWQIPGLEFLFPPRSLQDLRNAATDNHDAFIMMLEAEARKGPATIPSQLLISLTGRSISVYPVIIPSLSDSLTENLQSVYPEKQWVHSNPYGKWAPSNVGAHALQYIRSCAEQRYGEDPTEKAQQYSNWAYNWANEAGQQSIIEAQNEALPELPSTDDIYNGITNALSGVSSILTTALWAGVGIIGLYVVMRIWRG